VEDRYINVLHAVKRAVKIPVAVKLSPYFSSLAHVASRLDRAGANGLVLFNRFYQPDFDLDALEVKPDVVLSTSEAMRYRCGGLPYCTNGEDEPGRNIRDPHASDLQNGDGWRRCCDDVLCSLHHGPKHVTAVLEDLTSGWWNTNTSQSNR